MALNLDAFDTLTRSAVKYFWRSRKKATRDQKNRGVIDQGNRSGVTAGKNLNGFIAMVRQLIIDNGIADPEIFSKGRTNLSIPGFYRPTKSWDLLVVHRAKLLAAVEFKSQVGPSFGNNFNNRVEEALGNAVDLKTAFREGAFGESQKPFMGYFFVLEECKESMKTVHFSSPHFNAFTDFDDTSYAKRYELLCRKLVQEEMYDAAALLLTKKSALKTGDYSQMSEFTNPKRFASILSGKIAAVASE